MIIDALLLKVRRGETPIAARLKRIVKSMRRINVPFPVSFGALLRIVHRAIRVTIEGSRSIASFLYREPVFRSMCKSAGCRLYVEQVPRIAGQVDIFVGDDVTVSGDLFI